MRRIFTALAMLDIMNTTTPKALPYVDNKHIFMPLNKTRYEYLNLRYRFVGMGVTGEFVELSVNGARVIKNRKDENLHHWGRTEYELFTALGESGWQLISHDVQGDGNNAVAVHYVKFCRTIPHSSDLT